ncbi:hypothetical protein QQF64_029921 [Cirrhinus molitorella]|uniref:Reverse transcriptase n=1 Tax=Cirrhinus molitorella TaxID=172907 RepID=A0ABR3N1V1_9TELE
MVVKSAEVECRGPLTKSGLRQPPIRAYMDDLTITTTSVPGSRWILQGLERLITWASISFKPSKSSRIPVAVISAHAFVQRCHSTWGKARQALLHVDARTMAQAYRHRSKPPVYIVGHKTPQLPPLWLAKYSRKHRQTTENRSESRCTWGSDGRCIMKVGEQVRPQCQPLHERGRSQSIRRLSNCGVWPLAIRSPGWSLSTMPEAGPGEVMSGCGCPLVSWRHRMKSHSSILIQR